MLDSRTVGPGGPNLNTAKAEVNAQICHRWKDFSKTVKHYRALNVFGFNFVTVEGVTWQRHRKIIAPPFNERNSSLVFVESLEQGKAMLHTFTHDANNVECAPKSEPVIEDLAHWTMTAALYVIAGAAFNLKMVWPTHSVSASTIPQQSSPSTPANSTAHTMSFQESFGYLDYPGFVIAFPKSFLRYSPFKSMRHILACTEEFVLYVRELINNAEQNDSKGDLLSAIVKAGNADEKMRLGESETIGNFFAFIVAGHETTPNTVQTALLMLACEPDIQDKVHEELETIWASTEGRQDWTYNDYPKMRYTMGVFLETLRLFPPVANTPKGTMEHQTITYTPTSSPSAEPITIHLPPDTEVSTDIVSTQRKPTYWPDPHSFLPYRWLMDGSYIQPSNTTNEAQGIPNMLCPLKGAFMAFSAGFRAWLGRKFAQVEMAGLMAVLLKDHRIELVPEGDDEWVVTRSKALKKIDDRQTGIAMRMKENVRVRFVRRT